MRFVINWSCFPYYTVFDDLGFNVNNGVVTLYGAVTQPC